MRSEVVASIGDTSGIPTLECLSVAVPGWGTPPVTRGIESEERTLPSNPQGWFGTRSQRPVNCDALVVQQKRLRGTNRGSRRGRGHTGG